ncbi:MAG: hypothetical protein DMG79_04890 [Acidobacteria bacterium]|nr:MAG: hypothetical protein DMG79_04890 [Acidobacteriota bacterium]
MSEVVQETHQEFWRPPVPASMGDVVVVQEALPTMAEACQRCGTEFLVGSRFCHTCGGRRREAVSPETRADAAVVANLWEQVVARVHSFATGLSWEKVGSLMTVPSWLRYLHFHEIKRWVGLPTASLIAFTIGIACIAGALLVGLLTVKTFVDWQAIQFYRAEWLLGATASFVAGILLKKPSGN